MKTLVVLLALFCVLFGSAGLTALYVEKTRPEPTCPTRTAAPVSSWYDPERDEPDVAWGWLP